jgi:hypothetical protein
MDAFRARWIVVPVSLQVHGNDVNCGVMHTVQKHLLFVTRTMPLLRSIPVTVVHPYLNL